MLALIALVLSVQGAQPSPGPDGLSAAIEAAHAAWRAGTIVEARDRTGEALALLEQDRCAVSADAARLAYAAGLAGLHCSDDRGRYRYHLWAALRVDAAAGGLTGDERRVAREFASKPGESPSIDYLFARSPYLERRLQAAPECPSRFERPDPAEGEASGPVSIIIDRGRESIMDLSDHELLAAWPPGAGEAFSDMLRGYSLNREGYVYGGRVLELSLSRCQVFIHTETGEPTRICGLKDIAPASFTP